MGSAIQWPQGTTSSAISSLLVLSQLQLSRTALARGSMPNGIEHCCQNMQCKVNQWPCVQCAHATSTTGQCQMCQLNAKSSSGHVSNVPKQCKVNQWPLSNVPMQSQPMTNVHCISSAHDPPPPPHSIIEHGSNHLQFAWTFMRKMQTVLKCMPMPMERVSEPSPAMVN